MQDYILGIDLSIVLYANYYVIQRYENEPTANTMAKQIRLSENKLRMDMATEGYYIDKSYLCADRGLSWRTQVDGEYKGTRLRESKEAMYELFDETIELLQESHTVLAYEGVEADDWSYLLTRRFDNTILVSADGDYSLMIDNVDHHYFNFRTKEFVLDDPHRARFDKLVLGCPGDNVPRMLQARAYFKKIEHMYLLYSSKMVASANEYEALQESATEAGLRISMELYGDVRALATYDQLDIKDFYSAEQWKAIIQQITSA